MNNVKLTDGLWILMYGLLVIASGLAWRFQLNLNGLLAYFN